MTELTPLELVITTYILAAPVVSFVFIMHSAMEFGWEHPLYFGRRKEEKGIVAICRWIAIFLFAPIILVVWFGHWTATKTPNFVDWLTGEP